MAAIDLGKVVGDKGASMRDRGDWNATAQYVNDGEFIDTVTHNGSLYICVTTNTDSEPSETNTTNWRLAAQGGEKLVTLAEVALVTEPGFYVDAMAVKELNSNLERKQDGLLKYAISATNCASFNDVVETGQYWIANSTGIANAPADGVYGLLEVTFINSDLILQKITTHGTHADFERFHANGVWESWFQK